MAYARINAGPNRIVISEDWNNLALRHKVTVTPTGSGTIKTWSVTVPGTNPVIAFLGVNNAALATRTQSGGNFTFSGFTSGGSFAAYVFDEPDFGQKNYLVIRNPNTGKVQFDATLKYMRVRGLLQGSAQGGSITLPSGRTYAALAGSTGALMEAVGGLIAGGPSWRVQVNWRKAVVNINSNVASITTMVTDQRLYDGDNNNPQPRPGVYGNAWVRCPIIDVTNF